MDGFSVATGDMTRKSTGAADESLALEGGGKVSGKKYGKKSGVRAKYTLDPNCF